MKASATLELDRTMELTDGRTLALSGAVRGCTRPVGPSRSQLVARPGPAGLKAAPHPADTAYPSLTAACTVGRDPRGGQPT
jgi:hypothetical protein